MSALRDVQFTLWIESGFRRPSDINAVHAWDEYFTGDTVNAQKQTAIFVKASGGGEFSDTSLSWLLNLAHTG